MPVLEGEPELTLVLLNRATQAWVEQEYEMHDCNIVATMLAHGVRHLATRNVADFKRY